MTIRKGEMWGVVRAPDRDLAVVATDAALRRVAQSGRSTDPVGLLGGDMMRTVGGVGDPRRFEGAEPVPHLPIDVVHVIADGDRHAAFVAHLVARRSWWRGEITAVMNAQFIRDWDVAPRSHPNDGKVDIVVVSSLMSVRQRWMARSLVRLGTHVPHPHITVAQQTSAVIEFGRPTPIWLDGERWGTAERLELTVEADALTVVV